MLLLHRNYLKKKTKYQKKKKKKLQICSVYIYDIKSIYE